MTNIARILIGLFAFSALGCASMQAYTENIPHIPSEEFLTINTGTKAEDIVKKYGEPYFTAKTYNENNMIMYYPLTPVPRMMMLSSGAQCGQFSLAQWDGAWRAQTINDHAGPCVEVLNIYEKKQIVNIVDYLPKKKAVAKKTAKKTSKRLPASE